MSGRSGFIDGYFVHRRMYGVLSERRNIISVKTCGIRRFVLYSRSLSNVYPHICFYINFAYTVRQLAIVYNFILYAIGCLFCHRCLAMNHSLFLQYNRTVEKDLFHV